MPRNKTLITYIALNTLFLFTSALHLFIPLYTRSSLLHPPSVTNIPSNRLSSAITQIASNLLLSTCPLTPSIINSGIMFVAFLVSLPAITFDRKNRVLLQIQAWLIVGCALFTLGIGLKIWFGTLETRRNLEPVWGGLSTFEQSMLQWKFQCCGYQDVTTSAISTATGGTAGGGINATSGSGAFIQDGFCTNVADAVRHGGCVGPFSVFANKFLDVVFTTFFGFVVVDMLVLLSVLCVLKERKEQERYVLIDEKSRFGGI